MSSSERRDAMYCRYSSTKQDDGTTIEVQIERCEAAAGGPCVRYEDRAKTGRTVAGREAFIRLLADAEAGKIARLFVYKYDRLGRSAETHALVQHLEEMGVEVFSATEGKDVLARGIQLVVADHYSRVLAERTRDGLLKRFDQGEWTGGVPPYGWRVVTVDGRRRVAIAPEESRVCLYIVETFLTEAVGIKEIARRLNRKQVPSRNGVPWCHTTVWGILRNPMLRGEVRFNRRAMKLNRGTGRRVPRVKPAEQVRIRQDEAIRLIDDVMFDAVQDRIGIRRQPGAFPQAPRGIRPFTNLLFCECGSVFYARKSKNAKGEYRYYTCGCRQRHGPEACPDSVSVREEALVAEVTANLGAVLEDADGIIRDALVLAEKAVVANRGEAARLRREVESADFELKRYTELLMDPDIDRDAKRGLSGQMGDVQRRREQLTDALASLVGRAADDTGKLAQAVREAFEDAKENFASVATPEQLNRFVDDHVGPMLVGFDGVIRPKTQAPPDESGGVVIGTVAGGGFEPPTSGL